MTDWAPKIREGDARALARVATGVENRDPQALALLRELEPFCGHARIVGITGPPGAGKSTLVDALAAALRKQGKTVAVLAVDPTSRRTGGAILGDRIRMQQHYADPGIFIRSMATRGGSGGLAQATADLVRLMDAAGRDFVIIETVGVGQDEVEIAGLAHVTVVVLVPGMGDDVQTIKAGIMEIADIFVINKSDLPGADTVQRELEAMLSLTDGRKPPIVRTVARDGAGVEELLAAIDNLHSLTVPALKPAVVRTVVDVPTLPNASSLLTRGPSPHTTRDPSPHTTRDPSSHTTRDPSSHTTRDPSPHTTRDPSSHTTRDPSSHTTRDPSPLPTRDGSPLPSRDREGAGVVVTLRVLDLHTAVESLLTAGARVLDEPQPAADAHRRALIDPAGILLELIQENPT